VAKSRHASPEENGAGRNAPPIVIAGPNGAGKTTFAREFLPKDAGVIHFVNADLIAGGLSPLRPELATLAGGRLFLGELDRLARARVDFAFESTLSGLVYLNRLKLWKSSGYHIEISYLRLSSPQFPWEAYKCQRFDGLE
jgi:predicted ABC-type ATPase